MGFVGHLIPIVIRGPRIRVRQMKAWMVARFHSVSNQIVLEISFPSIHACLSIAFIWETILQFPEQFQGLAILCEFSSIDHFKLC